MTMTDATTGTPTAETATGVVPDTPAEPATPMFGSSGISVELGNPNPLLPAGQAPTGMPHVTYVEIPQTRPTTGPDREDHHGYLQVQDSGLTGIDLLRHLGEAVIRRGGVTHLPGHEPVLVVAHPLGAWANHIANPEVLPTWVWSSTSEVERILSEFYGCPRGRPADVEQTHYTHSGPPGTGPALPEGAVADVDLQANISKNGRDIQSRVFGQPTSYPFGKTTSAPTSTTLTLTGFNTPGSTTKWNGLIVVVMKTATGVWGRIKSNTTASPAVATVDRWYKPTAPGTGSAGTTPANTSSFMVVNAPGPCWFMGLSASTSTPGSPSTTATLPTEIVTATGGLIRQISPWAHTAGAATTTLTPVFTANTHDSLPVTVAKIGVFNSMVHGDAVQTMFFITKFGTTATLSASGDQLTVTETVTGT